MGHHEHIRLQADQEVKGCKASDMLPEAIHLGFGCQFLLCNLLDPLTIISIEKTKWQVN